ncbi:TATA-binding protein-associated factor mot1 [Apiotrichum porosum]|uniref:TATA-binding protein-associated factor mot1 n=1 Tax=Apiotrichum porosum TaxID=105984 RepID=A0A427XUF1_9TREE|nr:TATA-binding protein-associated factor mot1 [Apiotrichum porosum]RSH82478.1 TATA-binding protein-associated factor mot1 [Apiotrichum porosum]
MSKLILLLDSGTSTLVRRTAAKQLADVALKTFSSLPPDDAWPDALETIAKLIPLLRSRSSETRNAAANALGLIAQVLPAWQGAVADEPCPIPCPDGAFDVPSTVVGGEYLLASAGREYIAKPGPADRAKRRKAMMGAVGLGGGLDLGGDMDKVLDDADDKEGVAGSASTPPSAPSGPPVDLFEGLSARQIAMLKRKKGNNMVEEANKMRRLNDKAASGSDPNTPRTTPKNTPPRDVKPDIKSEPDADVKPDIKNEAVVIDPGAKKAAAAAAAAAGGGAVEPHESKVLKLDAHRHSPWSAVVVELAAALTDPAWEVRHGAALGLMEVVRSTGSTLAVGYPGFLSALARRLLVLVSLDRFGDFVGDTVMAPVRETAAQALGVLFRFESVDESAEVHAALVQMVNQPWAKRGKEAEGRPRAERFSWELRHAGLLGLKYEVAVRDPQPIIHDVVACTLLALRDADDDVRTVAASALLPITSSLVTLAELDSIVDTLWGCLGEGTDELGSSTGAVMDLLGALLVHEQVIALMAQSVDSHALISRIYAFIRHPIAAVRLAVAKALLVLVTVPALPRHWIRADVLSLLFQNLVLEDRADIRELSAQAFAAALSETNLDETVGPSIEDWYAIVMTPVGSQLDDTLFVGRRVRGHDVDKAMFAGDMSLVSTDTVLETRIAAAKALALLRQHMHSFDDLAIVRGYLGGACAHQIFIATKIVREWAVASPDAARASDLGSVLIPLLAPRATYTEMSTMLNRVHSEVRALFTAFTTEGKVKKDRIPELPSRVDPLGGPDAFTLDTARRAVGPTFEALTGLLKGPSGKGALANLRDRQRKVLASLGFFSAMKERLDIQVAAGVAGALISLGTMPPKLGPVVKAVMDGVKKEESALLQAGAADSVGALVAYCCSPEFTAAVNPTDKVLRNLFTFLNSDVSVTPVFSTNADGILSLKDAPAAPTTKKGAAQAPEETEEQIAARVTRRGALAALAAVAKRFGPSLFDTVPRFWECISAPLQFAQQDVVTLDARLVPQGDVAGGGQDLVDSLTSLRLVAPDLDAGVHHRLVSLFPPLIVALQSAYTVVRNGAARTLAALCNVATVEGMRVVVDDLVPLVGDAERVHSRQGAVEAIHHIIKLLDIKALPYVLFLIVPILGRMSDSDESVRLLATSTFASLVKMVPLEAGIPDPPGFSPELLAKRDEERRFLAQLLDGSRAEQYALPIEIKADLRQYQKDGVSWLAFLAKYQLHGILCDDMGLGKSLQTICIVGSMHHERAARHKLTGSVDSAHLPTLIVCPPTLTGHWYHEVLKFTDDLKPIQYVGNAMQRAALRPTLSRYDIVITSYESVRNDIAELGRMNFLYCVLDEGHVIKNPKTKLTQAVKQVRSHHRLLLSGTPIQNNVLELWSLFDFLMPGFLGSERGFNDRFSKPILADRDGKATPKEREAATAALEALHKQVLPFLLRRLKEDVLDDLPPKIIQDYYCDLSDVQKALYDEFSRSSAAEEAGEVLGGADDGKPQGQQHVFQSLQYLRKLCNHPALVLRDNSSALATVENKLGKVPSLHDISHAPKLEALKQLLTDCGIGLGTVPAGGDRLDGSGPFTGSHRVLIFCQLRPMLDLIETDLFRNHMPSVTYMRMDGATDPRKRHAIVETFNNDPKIDVLLLTTSVGGLGLNLTGADTVIFVDHDWNPMKDLQAMDRAHRLGQKKVVNVYRLITRGTLEEKIMGLQRFKLNIASSVVTQQNAGLGSMNTGEVLDLFQVSADGDKPRKHAPNAAAAATGGSLSKVLEGLDDLPPEDEYAELSMDNFLSKNA